VLRSRFAEDRLAEAVANGLCQYVLLGAGLDTFASRQPPWGTSLRIFEVDHPATQQWKLRRLAEAAVSVPENLCFVPIDFEKTSLETALSQAGLDLKRPVFFSMLGVSQYLTEAAFDQSLRFVLSAPAQSEIVFSFVAADTALPADDVALANAFAAQFAAIGEPWLLRFVPEQLSAKLTMMGFSQVFHLTPDEANRRYFQDRRDGLNASFLEQVIEARV
jgi:methyltransferase (TIGR00027 family)